LKDQLLHMYIVERKKMTKWYIKLFKRLLNSTVLNLFVVYRKVTGRNTQQPSYRIQLVKGLFTNMRVLRRRRVYRGDRHLTTQFHG